MLEVLRTTLANDLSPQRQVCLLRGLHYKEASTDRLPRSRFTVQSLQDVRFRAQAL